MRSTRDCQPPHGNKERAAEKRALSRREEKTLSSFVAGHPSHSLCAQVKQVGQSRFVRVVTLGTTRSFSRSVPDASPGSRRASRRPRALFIVCSPCYCRAYYCVCGFGMQQRQHSKPGRQKNRHGHQATGLPAAAEECACTPILPRLEFAHNARQCLPVSPRRVLLLPPDNRFFLYKATYIFI